MPRETLFDRACAFGVEYPWLVCALLLAAIAIFVGSLETPS